jgi:hypothetical protein
MRFKQTFFAVAAIFMVICTCTAFSAAKSAVRFVKYKDKTEGAFTCLIPKGWYTSGGIIRVDPNQVGGILQSIEAKFDFTVKSDSKGSVMMHNYPDWMFCDMRGQMIEGQFPVGSSYNGAFVTPLTPVPQMMMGLFSRERASAQDVRVVEKKDLPQLAKAVETFGRKMGINFPIRYGAGMITVEYSENGTQYKEVFITAFADMRQIASGLWKNTFTYSARAPKASFQKWVPVFKEVAGSFVFSKAWFEKEAQAQGERSKVAYNLQNDLAKLDDDITRNRRQTQEKIAGSMYPLLSPNRDFKNPYTGKSETGSSDLGNRFVNERGDVAYTTDPKEEAALEKAGFKQSKAKN